MEQAKVIQKYTVKINRDKIGKRLLAFIFVNIDKPENIENFKDVIVQHDCVLECHHVAGTYDYLLKVVAEDTQTLESFLSKTLKKMKGVSSTNTVIALITLKEEINF